MVSSIAMTGATLATGNQVGTLDAIASPVPGLETAMSAEASATVPSHAGRNVMLVDDVEMNRDILGAFLLAAGYTVQVAGSGLEAVQLATQRRFDLILMDICMPEMDGLDATRRIRELSYPFSQVPILALTSYGFDAQVQDCHLAGMNGHLQKPVDQKTLISTVDLTIAGARHHSSIEDLAKTTIGDVLDATVAGGQKQVRLDRAVLTTALAPLSVDETRVALLGLRIRIQQIVRLMHQASNWTLVADIALALAPVAGKFGFVRLYTAAQCCRYTLADGTVSQAQLGEALRAEACAALAELDTLSHEAWMEPVLASSTRAKGIIVVEDDPVSRGVVCGILRDTKQQVYLAADGLEAYNLADALTPSLVLLDVAMPLLNGLLACEAIRALPHCADVSIIMLTGYDDDAMQRAARRVGATDVITKPFRPGELLARLAGYIDVPECMLNAEVRDVAVRKATTQSFPDDNDSLRGGWVKTEDGEWAGPQAPLKGLRHRLSDVYLYGGIPAKLVQNWFGYAPLSLGAIGGDIFGPAAEPTPLSETGLKSGLTMQSTGPFISNSRSFKDR